MTCNQSQLEFLSCCLIQSVQFSHSFISNSLWSHGLQRARLLCPLPMPGVCSNSCRSSLSCLSTISSSVIPSFSCFQSFPTWGSFPVSQFFPSGGQRIGTSASASVLPMNIRGWFSLGLTGLISLQSMGLSRAFIRITIWKHQFFSSQPSICPGLNVSTRWSR